jgi:glycosyltransferase involved in cell wall biosynthesis
MGTAPRVTVLMPARNAAATIAASIQSVLHQTMRDLELIVVDDGSTDETKDIVDAFAATDPRVQVISGPARGEPAARNVGLAAARGRWTAMLDADDLACPDRLERQVAYLQQYPHHIGAASRAVLFVEAGRPLGISAVAAPRTEDALDSIKRERRLLVLCHPTITWNTDRLRELGGYDERFFQACDAELINRAVYQHDAVMTVMADPLVWYRLSATGMSTRGLAAQRLVLRYLEQRNRWWGSGVEPEDLGSYLRRRPEPRTRLRWWRHDVGASLYRRAGIRIGVGAWPSAVPDLLAAALLHPRYVGAKAWNQRFNRAARDAGAAIEDLPVTAGDAT